MPGTGFATGGGKGGGCGGGDVVELVEQDAVDFVGFGGTNFVVDGVDTPEKSFVEDGLGLGGEGVRGGGCWDWGRGRGSCRVL